MSDGFIGSMIINYLIQFLKKYRKNVNNLIRDTCWFSFTLVQEKSTLSVFWKSADKHKKCLTGKGRLIIFDDKQEY